MAIEVFKILLKQSPVYSNDLIKFKQSNYCFKKENATEIPLVRTTTFGLHSFRYAGATLD